SRINLLKVDTKPLWGKMSVDQMLCHCSLAFEQALGRNDLRPGGFMRFVMKTFFKSSMINDVPYKRNLPTAPFFIVADSKVFEAERKRLIGSLQEFSKLGVDHFDNREQATLGKLSSLEWSNLMYKHIDHHLRQFGV
ncbi:MAG: DUF1569 domain-containing protein, partial [Bacteroidota bacterium]